MQEADKRTADIRSRALEEITRVERAIDETETETARSRSRLTMLRREA